MLEAIDHQEELEPGKMFEECRAGRSAGVIGEPQGVGQRMFQQPGIVDGGQLHHPDPVAVPFLHERRDLDGATGLAHPAALGASHEARRVLVRNLSVKSPYGNCSPCRW
ncbi:kinase-associated lipoprotein B [Streptomyces atratus]|uniref:kinase-associated lipoprotein B n=1 Tax=Streptomyces atratus TaxID=1893 RepID=UPI001E5DDB1C|nr:kinase-associated lipoprotein B [Streptomyces atratus]